MIDAELGREDHDSTPATAIERGLEPLMLELTPEPDCTGGEIQKINK
jgi:hypothetical protein